MRLVAVGTCIFVYESRHSNSEDLKFKKIKLRFVLLQKIVMKFTCNGYFSSVSNIYENMYPINYI